MSAHSTCNSYPQPKLQSVTLFDVSQTRRLTSSLTHLQTFRLQHPLILPVPLSHHPLAALADMISRAEALEIASKAVNDAKTEALRLIKILEDQRRADQHTIKILEQQVNDLKASEMALTIKLNQTIINLQQTQEAFDAHLLVCTEVSTCFNHT